MKCRSNVLPLWKNPAANGPWYQVESNPVIPVDSRVSTPAGEVDDRDGRDARATRAATERLGRRVLSWRHPPRCSALRASAPRGPPPPRHPPETQPQIPGRRAATATRYGSGSNSAEGAEELRDPDQQRQGEHRGRQMSRARPRSSGSRRERSARGSQPGEADQEGDLGDAQQVAARAEHLAAAQQADDLLQLGDPQQLRDREVDEAAEREAAAERDDLADRGRGRAPRRAASQTPQLTPASAAEAIVIRTVVENSRPSSRPPNSRRRITAWATTAARGADPGAGDDAADAERLVEGQRGERRDDQVDRRQAGRLPGALQAEEGPRLQQVEAVGRQREGEPEERRGDQRRLAPASKSPRW